MLLFQVIFVPASASAQYFAFGRNKVQYRNFEWYYIQSEHFDVYFTEGGEYLAKFTADAAEAAYATVKKDFKYEINNRIAFIVYKSHNDFQQNNVINEYLEEGVGGVTELYKNRIVIPFDGDYRRFRHVIHHELIHAVVNDMIYGGSVQSAIANNIRIQLPLWFNEGIAEYQALEWDTNSDMFINDAIINNYLAPIPYLYGYFAYRGGQSVWKFISEKYGREKISEIMARLRATRNLDAAFRGSLGLSIEELSEKWLREQKVTYWPEIARREDINQIMKKLTDHRKDGSNYNTSPSISPQGDKFAFITDRSGYFDIYVGSTLNPKEQRRLVAGQRGPDFEELKILTPGITWSPDGKKIALATKAGEYDAIMMIDVETGATEKLTFEFDGIFSVDWSPDGDRLVFIGNQDCRSDVYIYNMKTQEMINVTNDVFSDFDPKWSPDGKKIYFASDRRNYTLISPEFLSKENRYKSTQGPLKDVFKMRLHDYSQNDLYEISLETFTMRRLTATDGVDESSPVLSPDGKKMLFVSDRNGVYNIYEMILDGTENLGPLVDATASLENLPAAQPKVRPITDLLSGIRHISISRDGTKLLGVGLDYGGFDIYMLRMPFERQVKTTLKNGELEPTPWGKVMVKTQTLKFAENTGLLRTKALQYQAHLFGNEPKLALAPHSGLPSSSLVKLHREATAQPKKEDSASTARPENKLGFNPRKYVFAEGGEAAKTAAQPKSDVAANQTSDATGDSVIVSEPRVNVKNFVFDRANLNALSEKLKEPEKRPIAENRPRNAVDEEGEYKVKRYRLSFTPDIVYGGAGYDAIWGARGSGIFAFSDLLGNHQISIFTNLQFDLQNSDYGITYAYLANRIDYAFSAFHQARFLGLQNPTNPNFIDFFRFRLYGASLSAQYPLTRFDRFDFSVGYLTLSKENLDGTFGNESVGFFYPSVTFTHDDSRPFLYAPISGTRYAVSLSGTAGSRVNFATLLFDYRTYFDFARYYSFVIRLSGAASVGGTPQNFFIGGTENWINRQFENNSIPISAVQDFIFTTPAIPLRGHNQNAQNGTRFGLVNLEFRFPFVQTLPLGPIPIPLYYLMGTIFVDAGAAWSDEKRLRLRLRDVPNGTTPYYTDILAGTGWGIRTVFLGFVVRFDMAWAYYNQGFSEPRYYISLGSDF
ncbi:MAG: peptidase MA family metallohydrolase [Chloroherpetonaceae bacterium]|nr:peptidase MA family metallohydrolase [Chloroherpetonaceae bacterium]